MQGAQPKINLTTRVFVFLFSQSRLSMLTWQIMARVLLIYEHTGQSLLYGNEPIFRASDKGAYSVNTHYFWPIHA